MKIKIISLILMSYTATVIAQDNVSGRFLETLADINTVVIRPSQVAADFLASGNQEDELIASLDEDIVLTDEMRGFNFAMEQSEGVVNNERVQYGLHVLRFAKGSRRLAHLTASRDQFRYLLASADFVDGVFLGDARFVLDELLLAGHRHRLRMKKIQLRRNNSLGIYISGEVILLATGDNNFSYSHTSGIGGLINIRDNFGIEFNLGGNLFVVNEDGHHSVRRLNVPLNGHGQFTIRF